MNHYIRDIYKFHTGPVKNRWLHYPEFDVYVRKASRLIPGIEGYAQTFDVANISVLPNYQRKGIFSMWLAVLESEAKIYEYDAIFVENVSNPHLATFLEKRGYEKTGPDYLPCYYLKF